MATLQTQPGRARRVARLSLHALTAVIVVLICSCEVKAAQECRYIQNTANVICETKPTEPKVIEAADQWIARNRPLWLRQGVRDSWSNPLTPICGIIAEFCQ